MLSKRAGDIRRIVEAEGTVSVSGLATRLDVSAETVRRDLRPLVDSGVLVRMHGAVGLAVGDAEAPFRARMQDNAAAKRRVAAMAADLVADGDVVMIDTGTTTSFVARALTLHRRLVVITNSTDVARILSGRDNRIFLAGGQVRADSGAVLGRSATAFAESFAARIAIVSAGAVDDGGIMDYDPDEADFGRTLLNRAERRVIVTDSSKFARRGLVRVCGWEDLDDIVSEAPMPDPTARVARAAGTVLRLAP